MAPALVAGIAEKALRTQLIDAKTAALPERDDENVGIAAFILAVLVPANAIPLILISLQRHSLATFLINKEQDTKTVQGLLRHANVSTTLGLYAQSVNSSMVEAQESMLKAILRNGSNAVN
jgi:hypothetical protein